MTCHQWKSGNMAAPYVFCLALLSLTACFCVCFEQSDRISDLRRCVDPDCKGVISYAKTLITYVGDHPKILSFLAKSEVVVFSKSAGSKPDLWGGEINGRRGYFPKDFVREYKVFEKNPQQIVPTEGDSVPNKVEERKPNDTSSEVGEVPSNANVSNVSTEENVISRPEKTLGNQSSDSGTEESKKEDTRPVTRRLLSLDDGQEAVSLQQASDQLPSPSETLIGSRVQDDDAKTAAEEEEEEEEDDGDDDNDDETAVEEQSESKSFIFVDGTKVEVDEAQEETPTLASTTLAPTRTLEEYAAPTVSVTPAPNMASAEEAEGGAISATSSSAFIAEEKVTAETGGVVEYGAGIVEKEVVAEKEEKGAWSFETEAAVPEREDAGFPKTGSEKEEKVTVEEIQVAEAKEKFSEEYHLGLDVEEVLRANESEVSDGPAPVQVTVPESLQEPGVLKEEREKDGTTVDGADTIGVTDKDPVEDSLSHPEESFLPAPGDLKVEPEIDETRATIASVLMPMRESLSSDVKVVEEDDNAVRRVDENENDDAEAQNVTDLVFGNETTEDLDVDVEPNVEMDTVLREEEREQESEVVVTPYANDEDADGGHCLDLDCEGPVTESGPLAKEEEDWQERWRGLDAKEAAKPYVEVISTYTQMVMDLLPEPLHVILLDLQERAVSPRVVVFTFIVGFFTFLIGFTYFALHYKIRGSGTLLAAKLNSLDRKLFTVMTEKDSLRDVVTAAERKIKILEDELRSAISNAETARKELKTAQSDNVRLQKALDSLESELNVQRAAASDLNDDARDAVQANLQLKQLLKDSRAEVASLQEQNANLLADAMSAETMKESLELQLTNQNEELDELRTGSEQLLKEAAEWDASVKGLQLQVTALTEENVETKGALSSKKKELECLEELVSQMKPTEGDAGSEDILAKVLDVARLKTELNSAMAENDTLRSKLKFEASVKEQLEEQLFSVAAETEKTRKDCAAAVHAKEDAEKRLQVLSNYFKEKETELQKELGLQEAKRQQTQETALTSNQRATLYEQEVSLYRSQIESLKKEIEEQERSFKVQVADHEKKAHNNWLAARNAERKLEEVKRESSMLRNKLTSLDQDKDAQTRSNPDGTTLQQNTSRFYSEAMTSASPNPVPMAGGPSEPAPPSSGPSSLYHEPIDPRRMTGPPQPAFPPPDRPLPPPHFLANRMLHPFGPMGPMFPGPPPPPPHFFDRGMPSPPPPEFRFGPPPPLFPIPRRRTPPPPQQQPFEPLRNRTPSPTRRSPFDARSTSSSARQWVPNLDARRESLAASSRQDLIRDPRTSSPLTSELNKSVHGGRSEAV